MRGHRRRLPPGGDPHHAVRRGAAARARGAGRRHLQRPRGGGRRRACARSSPPRRPRSTAWPRSSRPTSTTTRTTTARSTARPRSFNEGLLRSFNAMYGLDYVALRYFNVYGPRMDVHGALHRGAHPLDGAHRRRRAAADLRRRHADDGLRLRRRHRARQHAGRASADVTDEVFNVASGIETSLHELAEALLRVMGSRPRGRARARARGQRRHPPPRRHERARASSSASRPRSASRRACTRLVEWWRAERAGAPRAARAGEGVVMQIPIARPVARRATRRDAVAEADRLRLGDPGPAGRRVRARVRRARRRAARASPSSQLHDRAAPGAATSSGVGPGRRGHLPSLSFIATANAVG